MFKRFFNKQNHPQHPSSPLFASLNDLIAAKVYQNLILTTSLKQKNFLQNQHLSSFYGRGMEFAEVRHYQPGDEIRNIDWKVTARTSQPHTKLFMEEKDRNIYFCVDQRAHLNFGTTVSLKSFTLLKIAATMAWSYNHEQQKISGLFFNNKPNLNPFLLKPTSRSVGVMQLLQALIKYQDKSFALQNYSGCYLENIFHPLTRIPPGSIIIILSDFNQSCVSSFKKISFLRRKNYIHCVHIHDPIEKDWPFKNECYAITNDNKTLEIKTTPDFIKNYRHDFQQRTNNFYQNCCKLNINYTLLENNQALYNKIHLLK